MNIPTATQAALARLGLYNGTVDGVCGPMSVRGLMAASAGRKSLLAIDEDWAGPFWNGCVAADIDTRLRLLHAIAQCCVETGYWTTLHEVGSPAYLSQYDGRAALGNTEPGDGARFKGRGFLDTTGRDNYTRTGRALGLDLVNHPELLELPENAGRAFAWFWKARNVNQWADHDDLIGVTRTVNGGLNGLESRRGALARIKALWPA